MRSASKLFAALGTLADSILALASVVDVATGQLRQQLALDEAPPALPHGEILDAEEPAPSTKRNGRTSKAAA